MSSSSCKDQTAHQTFVRSDKSNLVKTRINKLNRLDVNKEPIFYYKFNMNKVFDPNGDVDAFGESSKNPLATCLTHSHEFLKCPFCSLSAALTNDLKSFMCHLNMCHPRFAYELSVEGLNMNMPPQVFIFLNDTNDNSFDHRVTRHLGDEFTRHKARLPMYRRSSSSLLFYMNANTMATRAVRLGFRENIDNETMEKLMSMIEIYENSDKQFYSSRTLM